MNGKKPKKEEKDKLNLFILFIIIVYISAIFDFFMLPMVLYIAKRLLFSRPIVFWASRHRTAFLILCMAFVFPTASAQNS